MNYRFFVIEPEDYRLYPEIPEEYIDLEDRQSIIVGASEDKPDEDDEILLGLMVCSVSVADENVGNTTYVWCRRQAIADELFSAMTGEYINELSKRNIKTVFFRLLETDKKTVSFFSEDVLSSEGCTEVGNSTYCNLYYLEDFYDTLFMRTKVIRASQDEHLLSFSDCTSEECRKYLEELMAEEEDEDILRAVYNSGSFFYMEKGKPQGAVMTDLYKKNTVIINRVCIKNRSGYAKILRSLLAGVLSGSMEGIGLDGMLFVNLDDNNGVRVLEECLGEGDAGVTLREYRYDTE